MSLCLRKNILNFLKHYLWKVNQSFCKFGKCYIVILLLISLSNISRGSVFTHGLFSLTSSVLWVLEVITSGHSSRMMRRMLMPGVNWLGAIHLRSDPRRSNVNTKCEKAQYVKDYLSDQRINFLKNDIKNLITSNRRLEWTQVRKTSRMWFQLSTLWLLKLQCCFTWVFQGYIVPLFHWWIYMMDTYILLCFWIRRRIKMRNAHWLSAMTP